MTEKLLTFPSPTSKDLVDGVNRSKFNFFPEQHQHKRRKTFVPGQHARIQDFFCQGGGGGGVQAPQLILQFTEGVQWFYYTFSRGGPTFSRGGGGPNANFYRNPCYYNLRFSRGVWTPYPPLDPQMYNVAFWHE